MFPEKPIQEIIGFDNFDLSPYISIYIYSWVNYNKKHNNNDDDSSLT
jgi:hypothetical protein